MNEKYAMVPPGYKPDTRCVPGQQFALPRKLPKEFRPGCLRGWDKRFWLTQEVASRLLAIMNDLGGEDGLSYMQRSLVERFVFLELGHQADEQRLARGEAVELGTHTQRLNALVGIAKALGLKRAARETRLSDYLKKASHDATNEQ